MDVFNRLAPFIQEFIYQNKWEELHSNQVAACEVIFDSDDNLLLSSGTASGKTEAAFLPVLTELYEKPSCSVGIMYKFLTVFQAPEYYLVKDENRTIGTVDKAYPVGVRFALAGMSWETVDINEKSKVIFVKRISGISEVDWDMDFEMEFHTVLVRKVRDVMAMDEPYPYLSDRCKERLAEIRYIARNIGILDSLITALSDRKYAIFPWIGTRQLLTLHYALLHRKIKNKLPWITSLYLEVIYEGTKEELEGIIMDILQSELDLYELPLPDKVQIKGKYNEYILSRLLRKQFIEDYLDFEGLKNDLK